MDRATSRTRRLVVALGLNIALAAAQVVGGLVAHSVGLLSDAGHNVTDVAGVAMSLLAVRWATRPRNPSHSFGYHRGPILAALGNAAVIAVITVAIVVESVAPPPASPRGARGSRRGRRRRGLRGQRLRRARCCASAAATSTCAPPRCTWAGTRWARSPCWAPGRCSWPYPSLEWADPTASLVVAAIIVVEAYRLLRASVDVLLESSPADVDLAELTAVMGQVPGVAEVHDLHVWSLSSDVRALSAHVVLTGSSDASSRPRSSATR